MTDVTSSSNYHHDLSPSRKKKRNDEDAVQALEHILQTNRTNPFHVEETDLISISTGATAPKDVFADLLSAQKKGEELYQRFQTDRLEKGEKFFDAIPGLNLKTFDNIKPRKFKSSINKDDAKEWQQTVWTYVIGYFSKEARHAGRYEISFRTNSMGFR